MSKAQGPINQKAVIAYCYKDATYKKALELAKKLYSKHKRPHVNVEYLSHPLTVATLLLELGVSSTAMVASALQDTLTRTNLKESTIRAEFGDAVAELVVALTPVVTAADQVDIEAYKAKLAAASHEVQTIKLASILDNVCAIPANRLAASAEFLNTCAELAGAMPLGNAEIGRRVQAALRRARA